MESNNPALPNNTVERRRHPRSMLGLPVEYRRSDDSRLRPGHTVNFSEGGIMILVSEQMEVGESLEMKIYFSSGSGLITIAPIVKVIWADIEAKEGGYYRVGVRYVDISPGAMESLEEFLKMYADPHQVAAELKPQAGSVFKPSKPSVPESPAGPLAVGLPLLTFLKRILSLGRRGGQWGKGRGR